MVYCLQSRGQEFLMACRAAGGKLHDAFFVPRRVQPYYYGTPLGAEIDLAPEFPFGKKWAIEIKRNSTPSISKGFYERCEDIKADKRLVVYSGTDRFSMGNDVTAISLPGLMQEVLAQNEGRAG